MLSSNVIIMKACRFYLCNIKKILKSATLRNFIERWNVACDKAGLGLASASYRALLTWATLSELDLPLTKILDYTVLKGALDPSDLIAVWENLQHRTTSYDTALRCYVDSAKAAMAML